MPQTGAAPATPAALLTFRIDAAGAVLDCDPAAAHALGCTSAELAGRHLAERIAGDWSGAGPARFSAEVSGCGRRFPAEVLVGAELAGGRTVIVRELQADDLGERHRALLSALAERLREESAPAVLISESAAMLGRHLGVNRVGYAEIDIDADTMTVEGDWTDGSLESAVGVYPFEGSLGPIAASAYRRGETLVFENVPEDPRVGMVDMAVLERMRIVSAVTLGLVKNGRLVGLLSAHNHHPRTWTAQDVRLVEEVAERMWAAIERARAELRLKDSEEQFRTFAENLPDLCWVADGEGRTFWFNRQHERYFGAGNERLNIARAVAPEEQEQVAAAWAEALARAEPMEMEVRLVCIDGVVRPFRSKATPVRDENGRVVRWCGVTTDISEQRTSEAVQAFLLSHAERLRPETSPGAVLFESCAMVGRHLNVDRCGYAEFDEDAGEIVIEHDWCADGLRSIAGRHPLDAGYVSTGSYRTGRTQVTSDLLVGVGDAERAALEAMSIRSSITAPLVKDGRLVGIFSVTQSQPREWTPAEVRLVEEVAERTWSTLERARAEAARRETEAQFRSLAENLPNLCWLSAPDGRVLWSNQRYRDFYAWRMRDDGRIGSSLSVHPDDRENSLATWRHAYETGEPLAQMIRSRDGDGRYRPFYVQAEPVKDAEGRVVRWCGILTDLSDQQANEARQTFLLELGEALRRESDPTAILRATSERLGLHMGVDRVVYGEVDAVTGVIVSPCDWAAPGLESMAQRQLRPTEDNWVIVGYREGRTLACSDHAQLEGVTAGFRALHDAAGATAFITAPLVKEGRLHGLFSVYDRSRRDWTPEEIELVEAVGERTWEALARARAEQAWRDSEEQFRSLAENLPNQCWVADARGELLWVNQNFRDFHAHDAMSMKGVGSGVVHPDDWPECERLWSEALRSGEPVSAEHRLRGADGVYRPFFSQAQPIRDPDGRVIRWCAMSTDLSEQHARTARQAFLLELGETLRRETEPLAILGGAAERLAAFLGVDRAGYAEMDHENGEVVVAKDWCAPDLPSAVGRHPKPSEDSWIIAGYARGVTLAARDVEALENTSANFLALYRFMGTRGMVTAPLVKDGRLSALFSVHSRTPRDWTAEEIKLVEEVGERTWEALVRARAEQAWRDSEQQFRSLAENLPDQCWVMDAHGELTWSNQKFRDWHAGRDAALRGDGEEVVHPADWPTVSQLWADAMAAGESVDTHYRTLGPDGAYHPFFSKAQPIRDAEGRVVRWFGVAHDLTVQRATERRQQFLLELGDALRQETEAGALMQLAVERLSTFFGVDLVGFAELDGDVLRIEHECCAGALTPLRGDLPLDGFGPSPRMAALATGTPVVAGDVRRELADDPMLPGCLAIGVEATLSIPICADGRLRAVLYANHGAPRAWSDGDVELVREAAERTWSAVERARSEAARRGSEALLTSIMDHAPVGIYVKDLHGRYVLVNPEMSKLLGRPAEELIGLTARDVVDETYASEVEAHDRWVMETGGTHVSERKLGYGQTGSYDWSLITRFPVTPSAGAPRQVAGINVNLSAQKAAESELERSREALYQSEKLTALGSLLAGVSHELNNPLSIVVAQAVMMERQAGEGALAERAKQIRAAADRCARIVQTFLAMARQRKPERRRVNLNEVVDAALELTAYGLRTGGVQVIRDQTLAVPPISADADQLHQVIINLVINAQQAMSEQAHPRELSVRTALSTDGASVVLEIADNGPGVPEELRRRIFEPFFTTKPQEVGTGVGLSFSQGLVESHGGALELLDTPRGAAFRVTLPVSVAEDEIVAPPTVLPAAGAPLRTALVVDDEPAIARALAEFLAFEGYRCDTAFGGGDAKARLLTGTYDLIVSDLRMPDIDGPTLFAWIKAERPDLAKKVAFATGDTLGATAVRFLAREGRPFMEKPFTPESLRQLLDDIEETA